MSKRNRDKRAPISCIEIEQPPIDESLSWDKYKQQMTKDIKQIPLTIIQNGKAYSAVDTFLKRMEGPLAIWSTIYCDKPERYDPSNRPDNIQAIIDARIGK